MFLLHFLLIMLVVVLSLVAYFLVCILNHAFLVIPQTNELETAIVYPTAKLPAPRGSVLLELEWTNFLLVHTIQIRLVELSWKCTATT